eukprot:SAG22_NODE_3257_length_1825_cov_1.590962_3_plen_71_part_00
MPFLAVDRLSLGCEIGQGLYTKVAQVVALTLGLDDTSLIEVQSTSTNTVPNGGGTVRSQSKAPTSGPFPP